MADLSPGDFAGWFTELWEHGPFPWQEELVAQVHETQEWPGLVDLPTGTGKTSLLDIAVFLQALDAANEPTKRTMPRRIVSVVDRRVVVDQTADRARHIAASLAARTSGLMAVVADRLRALAGAIDDEITDPPLLVATLRGAIAKDESWMRRPDVPAIVSSTIDQVGSRLLFRGYGISRGMRPIHAGLLGNDVLWLLDEVHLARPFADTLAQLRPLRAPRVDGMPDRWQVVEMSATPTGSTGTRFPAVPLAADSHPLIGRRLRATKPVERHEVKVASDAAKADEQLAAECVTRARALVTGRARTIGVIVNRVDTARLVHRKLREADVDSHLLTGRMRPVDRDAFWARHRSRLEAGRSRVTDDTPFVLVSTQCIEAGADLDLDAIVTEAAPLDALVQRFGRVDRLGDVTHAGEPHTSVVLARSTAVREGAPPDPIYENRLATTWRWMAEHDVDDFGIRRLPHEGREALAAQDERAPRLLETHLDQLSQTSHAVSADPDVARWLHGDGVEVAPDVQIVWRADIDDDLILRAAADELVAQELTARLAACPPASTEALAVPIGAARRWLGRRAAPVTDADGVELGGVDVPPTTRRPWIAWERGQAVLRTVDHEGRIDFVTRLRPGDVIVVPSTHGGITDGTWDPEGTSPVPDVAAIALHQEQRVHVVRFHPDLVALDGEPWPTAGDLDVLTARERAVRVAALLGAVRPTEATPPAVLDAVRTTERRQVLAPLGAAWTAPSGREEASLIVWTPAARDEGTTVTTGAPVDTDADDEANVFTGGAAPLHRHQELVGAWAGLMAGRLGLGDLAADLELAGCVHDEGKRDPRFQVILHDGDELAAAAAPELLAKSQSRQPSAVRRRQIRRRSGYPRNARHELTSLALIDAIGGLAKARDAELVAHLVASHHGWCRPFAPPVIDGDPVKVPADGATVMSDHGLHRIDAAPPERFWALTERYGWYGLAWLEAVLRLGDHRQSESEARQESA